MDRSRPFLWVFIALVILTAFIRVRLLEMPIERDIGEYSYVAQLILKGIPPYSEAYSFKMPGIYLAYALIFLIFGESVAAIHLGLIFVNLASIILVFLIANRLSGRLAGRLAGASFAVLSIGKSVHGFSANAEHFVMLFVLGSAFLLIRALESKKMGLFFFSGILSGLAFIMKQQGILFAAGFFLLIALNMKELGRGRPISAAVRFLFGASLPFGLICLWLAIAGAYGDFWFWVFPYLSEHVKASPPSDFIFMKKQLLKAMAPSTAFWIMAASGLAVLFLDARLKPKRTFMFAFAAASAFAVSPRLYFREHYFILALPAVSMLAALGMARLIDDAPPRSWRMAGLLSFIIICLPLAYESDFLFRMPPKEACGAAYSINIFPESPAIAEYIRAHTEPEDRIAILGSEPQILFYSKRRSVTGHIFVSMAMLPHKYALRMQRDMARDIEGARPKMVLFVANPLSWLAQPGSPGYLIDWFKKYRWKYYVLAGIVEIARGRETIYRWGKDTVGYEPGGGYTVYIFERK